MAANISPTLRLQKDLRRRPYGGGWWPVGPGVSHGVLDLVELWPRELSSIVRYAYISDDWDQSESRIPGRYRTRTLVLVLADHTTCRLVQIPADTAAEVAQELLEQASDPYSRWGRSDFASTFRVASTASLADDGRSAG